MPYEKVHIRNDADRIEVFVNVSSLDESVTLLNANRIDEKIWSLTYGYYKDVSKTEIELEKIITNLQIIHGYIGASQSSGREVFEITAVKKSDLEKWSDFELFIKDLYVLKARLNSNYSKYTWDVTNAQNNMNSMSTDDFYEHIELILQTYGKIKIVKENKLGQIKLYK